MALCHNKQHEREFVRMMNAQGYTCFRIAGSGQAEGAVCDCVLYLPRPALVEVKATKKEIFEMRSDVKQQLQRMVDACTKNNLIPLLAIKFKHRGWNVVELKEFKDISFSADRNSVDVYK